jgi:hypothetical protein
VELTQRNLDENFQNSVDKVKNFYNKFCPMFNDFSYQICCTCILVSILTLFYNDKTNRGIFIILCLIGMAFLEVEILPLLITATIWILKTRDISLTNALLQVLTTLFFVFLKRIAADFTGQYAITPTFILKDGREITTILTFIHSAVDLAFFDELKLGNLLSLAHLPYAQSPQAATIAMVTLALHLVKEAKYSPNSKVDKFATLISLLLTTINVKVVFIENWVVTTAPYANVIYTIITIFIAIMLVGILAQETAVVFATIIHYTFHTWLGSKFYNVTQTLAFCGLMFIIVYFVNVMVIFQEISVVILFCSAGIIVIEGIHYIFNVKIFTYTSDWGHGAGFFVTHVARSLRHYIQVHFFMKIIIALFSLWQLHSIYGNEMTILNFLVFGSIIMLTLAGVRYFASESTYTFYISERQFAPEPVVTTKTISIDLGHETVNKLVSVETAPWGMTHRLIAFDINNIDGCVMTEYDEFLKFIQDPLYIHGSDISTPMYNDRNLNAAFKLGALSHVSETTLTENMRHLVKGVKDANKLFEESPQFHKRAIYAEKGWSTQYERLIFANFLISNTYTQILRALSHVTRLIPSTNYDGFTMYNSNAMESFGLTRKAKDILTYFSVQQNEKLQEDTQAAFISNNKNTYAFVVDPKGEFFFEQGTEIKRDKQNPNLFFIKDSRAVHKIQDDRIFKIKNNENNAVGIGTKVKINFDGRFRYYVMTNFHVVDINGFPTNNVETENGVPVGELMFYADDIVLYDTPNEGNFYEFERLIGSCDKKLYFITIQNGKQTQKFVHINKFGQITAGGCEAGDSGSPLIWDNKVISIVCQRLPVGSVRLLTTIIENQNFFNTYTFSMTNGVKTTPSTDGKLPSVKTGVAILINPNLRISSAKNPNLDFIKDYVGRNENYSNSSKTEHMTEVFDCAFGNNASNVKFDNTIRKYPQMKR